jgi:hypothetical protein
MKIKSETKTLQLGVQVKNTFNIAQILRDVTEIDKWQDKYPVLGALLGFVINIFDITIQNPHLELISPPLTRPPPPPLNQEDDL